MPVHFLPNRKFQHTLSLEIICRGGVEDTRLEAKAKDTKKIRGQGQGHKKNPRPRPRPTFPRTDTLEAKDRNARAKGQGPRTQAQVLFKKKKVFTKIFQTISKKKKKKKGLHKNSSGNLHKKTFSKKFFKRSTKF